MDDIGATNEEIRASLLVNWPHLKKIVGQAGTSTPSRHMDHLQNCGNANMPWRVVAADEREAIRQALIRVQASRNKANGGAAPVVRSASRQHCSSCVLFKNHA
jgi:hypothetical protein